MKSKRMLVAIVGLGATCALILSPPTRKVEGQTGQELRATFDRVHAITTGAILPGPSGDARLSIVGSIDDPRITSGRVTSLFEATNASQNWAHDKCWNMANTIATNPHKKYRLSVFCVGNLVTTTEGDEFVCVSTPTCQLDTSK